MALKTILFLVFYVSAIGGSIFFHPIFGVIGYVVTYVVAPPTQWWAAPLVGMGMRFSFFMATALAAGMVVQSGKLRFPGKFYTQEILFILFILWIFLSSFLGLPNFGSENFAVKLLKTYVFLWMLIRIVDSQEKYEFFLWALILSTIYLGFDTLGASTERFGRIHSGVGGSDFAEGNFLAAHFAMVLPLIGVFIIKGSMKLRALLVVGTVFIVNGFVLCRSRGAFLALFIGIFGTVFLAPQKWRAKIIIILIIGMIGGFSLMDKGFLERMGRINVDVTDIEAQDDSSSGRLLAWRAALSMVSDHPLGIGQNNFSTYVGDYQPSIPGKDAHSTYFRCLAELGIPGILLLVLMLMNTFRSLKKMKKAVEFYNLPNDLLLHIYALRIALLIFLTAGMFITETYIEEFYWLLFMPVLLERCIESAHLKKTRVQT